MRGIHRRGKEGAFEMMSPVGLLLRKFGRRPWNSPMIRDVVA